MSTLGCNYEAPTFGAHYPDGTCIDGYMWDLDSGDSDGLTCGGDAPCPWCNTAEFLDHHSEQFHFTGNARQRRIARRIEIKKVRAWAEAQSSFPPRTTP